ncbi:MAG: hypothetical protein R2911_32080 [Caldilineaceae bacterium]
MGRGLTPWSLPENTRWPASDAAADKPVVAGLAGPGASAQANASARRLPTPPGPQRVTSRTDGV